MAWGKYRVLTTDHTKVPSNQTDLVVKVDITVANMKTIANGGLVNDGTKDIAFYTNSALTTLLKFKRVLYAPTTGRYVALVRLPTASSTVDDTIVVAYGNAAISVDQSDPDNVWDSNTKGEYDFGDGTTLSLLDGTAANNDMSGVASPTAVTGPIAGAMSCNGSSQYATVAAACVVNYPVTLEMIIKPAASVGTTQCPVGLDNNVTPNLGFEINARATNIVRAQQQTNSAPSSGAVLNTTNWHYVRAVFNSATDRRISVNGGAETTDATSTTFATPTLLAVGARLTSGGASAFFNGAIGFVRISDVVRSLDYGKATYNALVGTTFFSLGAEQTPASPATIITTAPPASANSGTAMSTIVVKATTDGTTIDTSYTGPCVATPTGPFGTVYGTDTILNCTAGVATFTNLGINGDGTGYGFTFTMTGMTPVNSAAITIIGTATAANQSLIAATGGNSKWHAVYDRRVNLGIVSAKVATWDDAVGTLGGRTPGPQRAQASSGNRPALNGTQGSGSEYVTYAAGSSQYMVTATDARFNVAGSSGTPNPIFVITIQRASAAGPTVGLAASETSDTTYPFMMVKPAGTDWAADVATDGTGLTGWSSGRFAPDAALAFAGGVARLIALGKGSFVNNSNVDHIYRFTVGGRQQRRHGAAKVATAGNLKLVSGRLGANYGTFEELWTGIYAGEPDKAFWDTMQAWAIAQHGAAMDTSKIRTVMFSGSSVTVGTTGQVGGDMMNTNTNSGTTSYPYYAATRNTGRGTFAAQGFDVSNIHAYNYGASGRDIQKLIDAFPYEIGVLADADRAGPMVNIVFEISNSIQTFGWNTAQVLAKMIEYKNLHDALGIKLLWLTGIDRGLGNSNGNVSGNEGWYAAAGSTGTSLSVNGAVQVAVNAAIVASPLTYGDGVIDVEGDASNAFKIGLSPHACWDTTYYNMNNGQNDKVHLAPAGYSKIGQIVKDWLDANDTLLYPLPAGDITVTALAPALIGRAIREAQRDTRPTIQTLRDTRPTFTFIR